MGFFSRLHSRIIELAAEGATPSQIAAELEYIVDLETIEEVIQEAQAEIAGL